MVTLRSIQKTHLVATILIGFLLAFSFLGSICLIPFTCGAGIPFVVILLNFGIVLLLMGVLTLIIYYTKQDKKLVSLSFVNLTAAQLLLIPLVWGILFMGFIGVLNAVYGVHLWRKKIV